MILASLRPGDELVARFGGDCYRVRYVGVAITLDAMRAHLVEADVDAAPLSPVLWIEYQPAAGREWRRTMVSELMLAMAEPRRVGPGLYADLAELWKRGAPVT